MEKGGSYVLLIRLKLIWLPECKEHRMLVKERYNTGIVGLGKANRKLYEEMDIKN